METFFRWFFFGVLIALVPVALNFLILEGRGVKPSFALLISRGELLLIAAVLCGEAVGRLIGSEKRKVSWKILAGGSCVLILFLAAGWYAVISADAATGNILDPGNVASKSSWMFVLALISSGSCVHLARA